METQKTISLPINTWMLVEEYAKETHQDLNGAIEVLLRHGYIRAMSLVRQSKLELAEEIKLNERQFQKPLIDLGEGS